MYIYIYIYINNNNNNNNNNNRERYRSYNYDYRLSQCSVASESISTEISLAASLPELLGIRDAEGSGTFESSGFSVGL